MKYELETIPIWETYKQETECPLCSLYRTGEAKAVSYYLGSSVMTPETRVQVNEKGFCPDHYQKLLASRENKHGLGLITHTHLEEQNRHYDQLWETWKKGIEASRRKKVSPRRNKDPLLSRIDSAVEDIFARESTCLICTNLTQMMNRYAFTIVYLWKEDRDFRQVYKQSRGFCMAHFPQVLHLAEDFLSRKRFLDFTEETVEIQKAALHRLESEVLWYTQKFDPQNDSESWGTSRDALERTIQKITGRETEG